MKKLRQSSTGFRGVYKSLNNSKPFRAAVDFKLNNRRMSISLGTFPNAEAAQLARIKFIDSLK